MKPPQVAVVVGSGPSATRVSRLLEDADGRGTRVAASTPASDRPPPGAVLVDATDDGERPPVAALERALADGTPVVTANPLVVGTGGRRLRSLSQQHGAPLRTAPALARLVGDPGALRRLARLDEINRIDAVLSSAVQRLLARMQAGNGSGEGAVRRVAGGEGAVRRVAGGEGAVRRVAGGEGAVRRVAGGEDELDGQAVAARLGCLAELVWGERIEPDDVLTLGMDWITQADAQREDGRRWQFVGTAVRGRCARVEPTLLPPTHPLAYAGTAPAVLLTRENAGPVLLKGPADETPAVTALVAEARALLGREPTPATSVEALPGPPTRTGAGEIGRRLAHEGLVAG